jgi:hypothetical protein
MQKPVAFAVLAFVVPLFSQDRLAVRREETIRRTLTIQRGDRLEVVNVSGSIRVVGGGGQQVEMVARRTVRAESDAEALKGEAAAPVTSSLESGVLRIAAEPTRRARCHDEDDDDDGWPGRRRERYRVSVDFELRVPRETAITVCTVNDGEIVATGMSGEFVLTNVNGAVSLHEARGGGRMVTVNGDVTATFARNPSVPVLFETVNGDIAATFQPGLAATLKMRTFNGGFFTAFDVVPLPQAPQAAPERRNGYFVYRSRSFAAVRAGRGGPELTFETLNGDVRVLRQGN